MIYSKNINIFISYSELILKISSNQCFSVVLLGCILFTTSNKNNKNEAGVEDDVEDEDAEDDRMSRHRRIHEPEVLSDGEEDEDDDKEAEDDDAQMDSDGGSSSGMEDFLKVGWLVGVLFFRST